uniref:CUB domain-containing protein n=1 Tax=Periophthalmus magnuspinnatus TaxID=409849 RepID=A0A3B4B0I2_9GOBI
VFKTYCACLNAPSGTITSPNYPNLYPHSRLCHWEVVAMPGRRVTLTINDLRLEGSGTSCLYDYVEVLNGLAADAPRLQRFCGTVPAGTQVESSGNTMTVVFRTDASVSNGGFSASYSTDQPAGEKTLICCGGQMSRGCRRGSDGHTSDCVVGCGGVIHADSGTIKSPNYPQNFPANSECLWHIIFCVNKGCCVFVLRFNRFDLEASSSCRYDYVAVYDGQDTAAPLMGTFCGSELPPKLRSSSNHLYLVFRTDSSVSGEGWRASYSQTLGTALCEVRVN